MMGVPDQLTGIKQHIYLPVPREHDYIASLYAKHVSGSSKLTVSIRALDTGKILGSADLDATSGDWHKYTVQLHLPPGSVRRLEPVDFAVSVDADVRVDLDQISLMPSDAVSTFDRAS